MILSPNHGSMTPMTHTNGILSQIINRIQKPAENNKKRLAVFDLDSTLFDVSPRLQQILVDFSKKPEFIKLFPDIIPFFDQIKVHNTDWGIKHALERAGLKTAPLEFQEAVRDFWRKYFFSNEYLQYDVPYEGAVHFVQKLYQAGVEIIYLTGRDQYRMGQGSPDVLKKWNFPLNESTAQLVLKPERSIDDALFKKDWFANLNKNNYEVIWFFENEPVNIQLVQEQIPEIDIIFFDSTHSGRAPAPDHLPKIKHFVIETYKGSF